MDIIPYQYRKGSKSGYYIDLLTGRYIDFVAKDYIPYKEFWDQLNTCPTDIWIALPLPTLEVELDETHPDFSLDIKQRAWVSNRPWIKNIPPLPIPDEHWDTVYTTYMMNQL